MFRKITNYGFPFLLFMQFILFVVCFLDLFNITYFYQFNRMINVLVFNVSSFYYYFLFILLSIWALVIFFNYDKKYLFVFVIFPFFYNDLYLGVLVMTLFTFLIGILFLSEIQYILNLFYVFYLSINLLSIVEWIFFEDFMMNSSFNVFTNIYKTIFYLGALIYPILFLITIILSVYKFYINLKLYPRLSNIPTISSISKPLSKNNLLFLFFITFMSLCISLYPWLYSINPDLIDVGVDIHYYESWLEDVNIDWHNIFSISKGSRPFMILFMYLTQRITGAGVNAVVRYFPVLLFPMLSISVFFFSLSLFNDGDIATWSSFFTVFGIQLVVGIYTYFLSNIFATILIFSSFTFLIFSLDKNNYMSLLFSLLFALLALFTHPWTFNQLFGPMILIIMIILYKTYFNERNHHAFLIVAIFIFCFIIMYSVNSFVYQGISGLNSTQTILDSFASGEGFWYSSIILSNYYYSGYISNIVLLILIIKGLDAYKPTSIITYYPVLLLVLSGILYIFSDGFIKTRLLFNIPTGIYASLGFNAIRDRENKLFRSFIITYFIAYVLMCIHNLV